MWFILETYSRYFFLFSRLVVEKNLETEFENLKEEVLANYLRRFYAEVRNKQGGLYSKTSLLSIHAAIYRQPRQNIGFNILVDSACIAANNVLVGQCLKLKVTLWVLRRDQPLVHVSVHILLIT